MRKQWFRHALALTAIAAAVASVAAFEEDRAVPDNEAAAIVGGACGHKATTNCSIGVEQKCAAITGVEDGGINNGKKVDTTSNPTCSSGCGAYFDTTQNCS